MVDPVARLRADEGVYEDSGGTDPCEDADSVLRWDFASDSTASAHAVGVSALEPTYVASDGGDPAVRCQNQILEIAHTADWAGWTEISWLVVFKHAANAVSLDAIWSKGGSSYDAPCFRCGGENASYPRPMVFVWQAGHYNNDKRNMSLTVEEDKYHLVAGSCKAAEGRLYLNGQSIQRMKMINSMSWGTRSVTIGSGFDGTSRAMPDLYLREIAWWDSALSEEDMATEIDEVMTRWSLSNDIDPPEAGGGGRPNLLRRLQSIAGVAVHE